MSSTISYLPNGDAERVIWLGNYKTKLPNYAAVLGITPAEISAVNNDYNMFKYIIDMLTAYKQTTGNIVAYKNLLMHAHKQQHLGAVPMLSLGAAPAAVTEGVFDRVSAQVQRIKASPGYTAAIGNDLNIIAPTRFVDPLTMQPELSVRPDAGRPHLKCVKGNADAVDLYVDRKDGSGFVLIGRLLKLDYIDAVSLPAGVALQEWDYKAMYVIGNNPVGLMSGVVSIVVKKM
jgi:hypothetical protein